MRQRIFPNRRSVKWLPASWSGVAREVVHLAGVEPATLGLEVREAISRKEPHSQMLILSSPARRQCVKVQQSALPGRPLVTSLVTGPGPTPQTWPAASDKPDRKGHPPVVVNRRRLEPATS